MKLSHLAGLAALALGTTACAGKHLSPRPAWLNLGGTWEFNARETASLAGTDTLRPARRGERTPGGGMRGGGGMPGGRGGMPGGRGGMPGGRGGMPGGGREAGGGPGFGMMMAQLDRFTIEQTDSTVFFRFAPKEGVVVPTNWHKTTTEFWPGLDEVELKAKWSDAGLVVERQVAASQDEISGESGESGERQGGRRGGMRGAKVTETYSRAPQSDRLTVTTEIGGRQIRRIYELVPARPPQTAH